MLAVERGFVLKVITCLIHTASMAILQSKNKDKRRTGYIYY